jgi:UDP-N-acetylglucosamine transferase subunit ALG13
MDNMILITVGTQDKQFLRILKIVENAIKKGIVKEDVIAQIGYTKFKSDYIKTYEFLSGAELDSYIKEASLIITHGGIGSLTSALNKKKKIFAMPRLSTYKEHINDHQENDA